MHYIKIVNDEGKTQKQEKQMADSKLNYDIK